MNSSRIVIVQTDPKSRELGLSKTQTKIKVHDEFTELHPFENLIFGLRIRNFVSKMSKIFNFEIFSTKTKMYGLDFHTFSTILSKMYT